MPADDELTRAVAQTMREAAARAILPRFVRGRAIAVDYKQVGEAVTAADRESEAILADRLARLIPGAGVVGEEAAHHDPALLGRIGQGTCWIVDPLDGTANFAAGNGPFGILIALAQDGVPIAGWIFDPLGGRLCTAWAGHGATIDGSAYRTPAPTAGRPVAAVTKLFADTAFRERVMMSLASDYDVQDSPRCAADQYPRTASGEVDVTLFTRTLAWDHAAGVVFLNEAGGRAALPDGTAWSCQDDARGLIAASCPQRWDAMANHLAANGIALAGAAAVVA